jgi:hypothetical protein
MRIKGDTESGVWHQGLLKETMDPVFDTPGDEFACPNGTCRTKDIHSIGVVAKAKFVSSGQGNFTGVFGADADYGLVRLSVATPPDPNTKILKPGMGLKFLRDGVDSANLLAMYSVDGQPSWNFFENDWNTIIPTPSQDFLPVNKVFATATKYT